MKCTLMSPRTHWRNVGYNSAKAGVAFEAIRLPRDGCLGNQWILEGMERWEKQEAKRRAAIRRDGIRAIRQMRRNKE